MAFFIFFLSFSANIRAQELIAKFHDWNLFRTQKNNKTLCYIASTPIKREGNYLNRGEPYFLVVGINNDIDEVSVSLGFLYNQASNVELSFGAKKFYLFPYKTIAWSANKNDDIEILKEMQKNADMILTAIASDNKIAIDTYSLIGFNEGYKKLKEICEISKYD
ncbi:MAG: invasion associated locus B family protein [Alphaproteobacteria bacterium]